ncbi:hypothetical protein ACA910_014621 [Epithemia clementina (nom. ined.)]
MKWVRMIGVLTGLLLAIIQEFLLVAADLEDDIRLGVTIRNRDMLERAPSCMHTFSRVELVNQHNDEVVIKSIEISPETMLRVDGDGMEYDDLIFDSSAPQLHASKVTDDFVVLDPGQSAIVPLTFLPRFPPLKSEADTLVTLPADLSPWQQADREGWIGSVNVRNNLGYEVEEPETYRVTTILLVETNFGVARIPFNANSVRDNPYLLPDVIYFSSSATDHDPSKETFQSYVAENGIRIMDSHWNVVSVETYEPEPDCYDLYLKHPEESFSSIDIFVHEAMVSKPENVSLRIIPEKDHDVNLIATGPQQTIREWTEQGGLLIPPDDEQHYLATICNDKAERETRASGPNQQERDDDNWMDPLGVNGSLGFVQIRTDSETLYVSLFESEESRKESRALRYFSDDANFSLRYNLRSSDEDSIVQGYPKQLEVVLVNGTTDLASLSVGLKNTGISDITVMKTTLAFHDKDAEKLKELSINVTMRPVGLEENNWFLGSGGRIDDAVAVNISWDLSRVGPNVTAEFHGKILVQGSRTFKSPRPWIRATTSNPSLDADTISEIPLLVRCVEGRIGISRPNATLHSSLFHVDYQNPASFHAGAVEAAFFPRHKDDLYVLDEQKQALYSAKRSLEHNFHAYSTINASISLKNVYIVDANGTIGNGTGSGPCDRFHVIESDDGGLKVFFGEGILDLGAFVLRYDFPQIARDDDSPDIIPSECFLRFTTTPETGKHYLPLLIFSGRVDVSVDEVHKQHESGDLTSPSLENQNRIHSTVGFPQMLDWFQNSKAGVALRSLLSSKRVDDKVLLSRYLYSLSSTSSEPESSILNPILLKVGAINPDEREIIPLFITNYNPVPSLLRIDVGEVEGLTMTLGRNPVEGHQSPILAKAAPQNNEQGPQKVTNGPFDGHPVEGLKRFLQSDPKAQSLLSFAFHDAVELSEGAVSSRPLLKNVFTAQSALEYHKEASASDSTFSADCKEFGVSQPYSKFLTSLRGGELGPVTISPDSKSVRALPSCGNATRTIRTESVASLIVLPPGGVARFDITLQSPPVALLDHDISQFLITGLVLTTENAEVMPLFVTFETPRGKLDVSPDFGEKGYDGLSSQGIRSLRIPAGIFNSRSPPVETIVRIPPKSQQLDGIVVSDAASLNSSGIDHGVSLFMTSSFKRPVELIDVVSCNPLFEVVLRNGSLSTDPILGVNIGKIKSVVPCAAPAEIQKSLSDSPSFFLCALNWLVGRKELQPSGCGGRLSLDSQMNGTETREGVRMDYGLANRAFSRALFISAWSRSQKRSADGTVAPALVDAVAKASNIWKVGHESNLLRLSTSLRAVVRYNSSAFDSGQHDTSHVLSLAMANLTVESTLEMPTLISKASLSEQNATGSKEITVDFAPTYVGAVSSRMIHVSNPTGAPVKVRLAVAPPLEDFENYVGKDALRLPTTVREEFLTHHEAPYTQSGLKARSSLEYVSQQWWDGSGSFFLADFWGGLVRSHYNITVRAASGALVSLLSPGLLSNAVFIAGCGARCAVKDEVVKFDGPHDVRSTSFLGASAAEGSVLMGQQRLPKEQSSLSPDKSMFFKAGGSMLTGGQGPSPFSIPFFALKEEVEIPPFGVAELGPVLFRPPGRTKNMGCESGHRSALPLHCGDEGFTSTLFLENSLTGLEKVLLRGTAVWERVVIQDVPVQDGIESFSDIEMRNGRDALIFPGTSEFRLYGSPAVVKHLMAKNDGDVAVTFLPPFLTSTMELDRKTELWDKGTCSLGEFTLHPCSRSNTPIQLKPGENYSFFVQHEPRCTQLSSFVALVLEYRRDRDDGEGRFSIFRRLQSRKTPFRKTREELLLGYKMDAAELASCISSGGHVVFSFLDAMNKLGLKRPENNIFEGYGMVAILAFAMTYTFIILMITASGLILVRKLVWRLTTSSAFAKRLLEGSQTLLQAETGWLVSLRFLSRLDPSSQDIQTMSRDQNRMVLLQKFRVDGVLPPLCITASGLLQRERTFNAMHSGSRSGISTGGGERIRTLSDAIFKNGKVCISPYAGLVSFGAGWKTALARGIINDFSIQRFKAELQTEQLLQMRKEHPSLASEEESGEFDSSSEDNEADSTEMSYLSNEDNELQGRQSGEIPDQEMEDDDSESESTEDDFSRETFGSKTRDYALRAPSLRKTSTQSPMIDVTAPSRGDTAEYTKVMHKGKSSKKLVKQRSATVLENRKKNNGTAGTVSTAESSSNLMNHSSKPTQPTSSKVDIGKSSKRKIEKTSNGKLSAQAAPFEPRPSDYVDSKSVAVLQNDQLPGTDHPSRRLPPGLPPPPGFEGSDGITPSPSRSLTQLPIDSFTSPGQLTSIDDPPMLPVLSSVQPPISGDDLAVVGSPVRQAFGVGLPSEATDNLMGSLLVSPPPPPSSHNINEDGFDIMEFLDGVLNEGRAPPVLPGPPQTDTDTSVLTGPSLAQVPLNPWAANVESPEFRSRAAAYGINFDEDTSERTAEGVLVDLPMLTPAAILGHQDEEEDKNGLSSSILK